MEKITWKQFKNNLISQPYFIWNNSLQQGDEDDFDSSNFWNQDIDFAPVSVSEVISKTFHKIKDETIRLLVDEGGIVLNGSTDEKIEDTKKYINSDKLIIGPIFEYKGAIVKPIAFDFGKNIIYDVKYSSKTKIIDWLKSYYQIGIISGSLNLKISDYWLYLPQNITGKKGQINLTKVNQINISKNGDKYDAIFKKTGELKSISIIDSISKVSNKYTIKDIDIYIKEINDARNVTKISTNLLKDSTIFGDNPNWDELLQEIENEYHGYNGHVVSKKNIANNDIPTSEVLDSYEHIETTTIFEKETVNNLLSKIKNSKKIVWYDFEGFSLPYPPIDSTKSYQQIVFQLSKIITDNNVEQKSVDNIIWDPKNIDKNNLFEIIECVYSKKANYYIVYNQGYENARLREMVSLLKGTDKYNDANKMYEHINKNTIDLWDLFKITKSKKNPPILLSDQNMRSSIKNIEKHISKNNINVGYKIKEYKNLDIKNGGMAMQAAIERAVGIIGDKEWVEKEESLKQYCENDVKAMIMVYYFIVYILEKNG